MDRKVLEYFGHKRGDCEHENIEIEQIEGKYERAIILLIS